ncbi:MAG: hypothetical protein HOH58_02325 [Opitutaceae bacterium]|jgi:hypothetical protein|nr:hypothetical protein [Opitutaceae bacterium]
MKTRILGIIASLVLLPVVSSAQATVTPAEVVASAASGSAGNGTTSVLVVMVPVNPVVEIEFPSTAPLGVSLTTEIELDEPDPLALTVAMPPLAINPGTTLTLRPASSRWNEISNVQWFKNGEPIAIATNALRLSNITSADTGSYRATLTGDGNETGTVFAHVLVQPGLNHPLTNVSTRGTIGPENPQVIVGFSIPQKIASEHRPKTLLIRAVGDTLQDFGVSHPLPDPEVHIFDAEGNDLTPAGIFPAVVYDDGTTPRSRYYERVATAAQVAGAFPVPVPGPESPPISEFSELVSLAAGPYTVVVTSAGGQSGEVLVEVYDTEP